MAPSTEATPESAVVVPLQAIGMLGVPVTALPSGGLHPAGACRRVPPRETTETPPCRIHVAGAAHDPPNGGDGRQKSGPSGPPSGWPSGTVAPRGQGSLPFPVQAGDGFTAAPCIPPNDAKPCRRKDPTPRRACASGPVTSNTLIVREWGHAWVWIRAQATLASKSKKEKRNFSSIILRLSLLRVVVTVRSGC